MWRFIKMQISYPRQTEFILTGRLVILLFRMSLNN